MKGVTRSRNVCPERYFFYFLFAYLRDTCPSNKLKSEKYIVELERNIDTLYSSLSFGNFNTNFEQRKTRRQNFIRYKDAIFF